MLVSCESNNRNIVTANHNLDRVEQVGSLTYVINQTIYKGENVYKITVLGNSTKAVMEKIQQDFDSRTDEEKVQIINKGYFSSCDTVRQFCLQNKTQGCERYCNIR